MPLMIFFVIFGIFEILIIMWFLGHHESDVIKRNVQRHTGQCKRTGGCYNELVVAFFSTGGGVKGKKFYTC